MKKSAMLLVFAVVVSVGIAVKLSTREEAAGAPQASHNQTTPMRINKEFDLAGGSVESIAFTAPGRPGTLSGKWHASGKSGHDAALSGFTLTDPSDAVLDSAFKGSSGSFQVKVSAAGKHTFFFENAGKKQTPRHVTLDAEFTPD
jgi:hypothetical protein